MNLNAQQRVIPIPILNVKIFLVQSQSGMTLVDAGLPFQERRIETILQSLDVKLTDIQTIILTHGHLDHIGCLSYLVSHSDAVVICHRSIQSALENGGHEKAVPRVFSWKLLNPIVSALLRKRLNPVQVNWVVDECLDLHDFGLNGTLLHTPGHSPGSCSIFLEDGTCFLGDLLREPSPGNFDTGLFYHDRDQILTSLKKIAALKPERIYLSHGTMMTARDLDRFLHQASHQPS